MEHQVLSLPPEGGCAGRPYDRMWRKVSPGLEAYAPAPLPGEQTDPCCMGSAAAEMLQVIGGYCGQMRQAAGLYRCCARGRSGRVAAVLRQLAGEKEEQARRLQAVYYLISGQRCRPSLPPDGEHSCPGQLCRALRQLYHEESCDGVNFLRSAGGTADPCLQELFRELSRQSFAGARCLLQLLQQQLGR